MAITLILELIVNMVFKENIMWILNNTLIFIIFMVQPLIFIHHGLRITLNITRKKMTHKTELDYSIPVWFVSSAFEGNSAYLSIQLQNINLMLSVDIAWELMLTHFENLKISTCILKTLFCSCHKHVLHKSYFLCYRIIPILRTTKFPSSMLARIGDIRDSYLLKYVRGNHLTNLKMKNGYSVLFWQRIWASPHRYQL